MLKFKFKFSTYIFVLILVCVAFSFIGVVWNAYSFSVFLNAKIIGSAISNLIVAFFSLVLLVCCLAFIFLSKYMFKEKILYASFGFFLTKIDLDKVKTIHHFLNTGKIVLLLCDDKSLLITVDEKDATKIIDYVIKTNKNVSLQTSEENKKDKSRK